MMSLRVGDHMFADSIVFIDSFLRLVGVGGLKNWPFFVDIVNG